MFQGYVVLGAYFPAEIVAAFISDKNRLQTSTLVIFWPNKTDYDS